MASGYYWVQTNLKSVRCEEFKPAAVFKTRPAWISGNTAWVLGEPSPVSIAQVRVMAEIEEPAVERVGA